MIDSTFLFLKDQINNYLNLKTGESDTLDITPLTDNTGQVISDKLGLTLVNIEEERSIQQIPQLRPTSVGTVAKSNPKVRLNFHLLFSANFDTNYDEALKHIGYVITFFQAQNVFSPVTHPGLPTTVEKLVFELLTLSLEQQNNMWAALGAKYRPSIVYKMRMLLLEDDLPLDSQIPITEISRNQL